MQRKLLWHQLFLFGILLLMTGLRLLVGQWQFNVYILLWWLGAIIGFLFVFFDQLYVSFWQDPEQALSMKMKELVGSGRWMQGLVIILNEQTDQQRLVVRSVLFLATWVVMGIFTITSVGAPFGRGFMLGVGMHLSFDLLMDYFGRGRDIRLWFWQIKREILPNEIVGIVWGWVILFVLIGIGL